MTSVLLTVETKTKIHLMCTPYYLFVLSFSEIFCACILLAIMMSNKNSRRYISLCAYYCRIPGVILLSCK